MLFPKPTFADIAWSKVARATNTGKLGVAAKIATSDGSGRSPVICVYTHDFADKEDVMRGKPFPHAAFQCCVAKY